MKIKDCSTKELLDELQKREGVDTIIAGPYENKSINLEGPAVVLVVID